MDLAYLHMFQNFRDFTGDVFTPFFEEISQFIISFWPMIIFSFIYWVIKKEDGFILLLGIGLTGFINGIIKVSACVYRPWIRDTSIVPAGNSINTATGYSLPSGHSSRATFIFGSIAKWLWKKNKVISIFCIAIIALICLSRNYLGVHTPQDVLLGFAIGGVCIFLSPWIYNKMQTCKGNMDIVWFLGTIFVCMIVLLYINFKPYPIDYANNKIIVDPIAMMPDCYYSIGSLTGYMLSWFVDRRFIKYKSSSKNKYLVLIAFVMIIPIYYWSTYFVSTASPFITKSWAMFIRGFVLYIYIIIIVPIILKKCQKSLYKTVKTI